MNKLWILLLSLTVFLACQDKMEEETPFIPSLELSQDLLLLDSAMTSTKITVNTNGGYWDVDIPDNITWVECAMNNVPGAVYLVLKVAQNKGAEERFAEVTVVGEDIEKKIKIQQMGASPSILTSVEEFNLRDDSVSLKLYVKANMEHMVMVPDSSSTWLQLKSQDVEDSTLFNFEIRPNGVGDRSGYIVIHSKDSSYQKLIPVKQSGRSPIYKPGNPASVEGLVKLPVIKASSSCSKSPGGCHQGSNDAAKMVDGDMKTLYHSAWAHNKEEDYPITFEFEFGEDAKFLDYVIVYPRNGNGAFKEFEVWYQTADYSKYTKLGDYDGKGNGNPITIELPDGLDNPRKIKFILQSGTNGNIACNEMEFLYKGRIDPSLEAIFTDHTFSALLPDVTYSQIMAIENSFYKNIAKYLFYDQYPTWRILTAEPYQNPDDLAKELKTSSYSQLDNPCGIFVKQGEELLVFIDDLQQQQLSLAVVDFNQGYKKKNYALISGVNRINMEQDGLLYLAYYSPNYQTAPDLKVHIATGGIYNGLFDLRKHKDSDWNQILNSTVTNHLDVIGKHMHLVFPVESYKSIVSSPTDLITTWDRIVSLEFDLLGLARHNREIKNRMLGHVIYGEGYMYAATYRTAYHQNTLKEICNVSKLKTNAIWGPAHEIGHVNQTRPGLRWMGMTEVTNNIFSLHVQHSFGNESRLKSDKQFDKAFTSIVSAGIAHAEETDVFSKLVPFWQLYLLDKKIHPTKYLYEDMHEAVRNEENPETHGECQLNFVKRSCDILELDLTDFFKAWGLLKEVDHTLNDYGEKTITCTAEEVKAIEQYIEDKNYEKAPGGLVYLHDDVINVFKNKESINKGTASINGKKITMVGWSNVIAYEVYENDKLKMASPNSSFTLNFEIEPNNNIAVKAVAWDGERIAVDLSK